MHNMVGGSFDMSHEPHGSQAHGRIPYWACVGTIWAMLEPYWAHLGPFWALFGSVSAFVLDSGMSASLTFRPCKACAKNTKNTRKKYNLWTTLLMVFAFIFLVVFVSFFRHAVIGLSLRVF